ncbi:MAG: hypothetical protein ABI220_02800 [Candidatus Saccharimonadales bacterium]
MSVSRYAIWVADKYSQVAREDKRSARFDHSIGTLLAAGGLALSAWTGELAQNGGNAAPMVGVLATAVIVMSAYHLGSGDKAAERAGYAESQQLSILSGVSNLTDTSLPRQVR